MHSNRILKEAVITALAAISIGLHHQAFAVGLGEVAVKSHIGQPLLARINVQGVSELKDKACFRISNGADGVNPISRANLKLSHIKGDEGVLTITTTEAIHEPIVSMSIIAECDAHFRRDYVMLIDPLLTTETALSDIPTDENLANSVELIDSDMQKSIVTRAQSFRTDNSNKRKNTASKQTARQNNDDKILRVTNFDAKKMVKYPAEIRADSQNIASKSANHASTPRLNVSGSNAFNDASPVSLRLDKQLHFATETAAEALAGNIAIADEAAALNNRLAHLEQQITALQQRNNALEAEKRRAAQTPKETKTSFLSGLSNGLSFSWWPYLAGAGLLLAGYFAADFWRRRRQSQQLDNAEEVWNVLDANANAPYYKDIDISDTLFESKPSEAALAADKATLMAGNFEESQAASAPIQIEHDLFENNILDHADVFLSHGRTSLAIQLLQNHLLDFPKQSATIWLFLLDLLAKENLQALYEQTTLECKEHFNIRIPAFSNDEASPKQHLEDFPRLTAGLEQVWGTPSALVYLDDLIYNSRLENRVGFEKNVLEELVLLRSIAQSNTNKADVIQLDEKKMAIKEMKEAKLAANKADKLQKLEALTLVEAAKNDAATLAEAPEELFEFNLIEYK